MTSKTTVITFKPKPPPSQRPTLTVTMTTDDTTTPSGNCPSPTMESITNQPSNRNTINYRDQLKKDSLERRRNIVHLIIKYLEEHNYKSTVDCLLDECQVEWQYQVCENVDLEIVLQEYQSYYHTKFQKYPKILRKVEDGARPQRLVRKRSNEKARIDVRQ